MHHASTFQVDSRHIAEFIFSDLACGTFGCDQVQKKVCFVITKLHRRLYVGFHQKAAILGIFNVLGSCWILITSLAWRYGELMQHVADVFHRFVAYYCLQKLKLKDVLYWH